MTNKEEVAALFDRAITASQCRPLVKAHLEQTALQNPLILSIGKSAAAMGWGARDLYPDAPLHLFTSASYAGETLPPRARLHAGEHPQQKPR